MRNESKQKALRETLETKQSLLETNFILFCNKDGSFEINVKRKGDKASELIIRENCCSEELTDRTNGKQVKFCSDHIR